MDLKAAAGRAALDHVSDGMVLGIGTGSTAEAFVHTLGEKVSQGLTIVGVPTSTRTAELCRKLGVPLTTLDLHPQLDLTIDGADEIGPKLSLIKGGGGALLYEKIVACASRSMLVIADESKLVDVLGKFPLPIEVMSFGLGATQIAVERLAEKMKLEGPVALRTDEKGEAFRTDGGHLILDASFGRIPDPKALAQALNHIPGVVEHGLFVDVAGKAIVAGSDGIQTFARS